MQHTHTHTHTHTHMYVYTHTHMYVYTHTSMCTHTHTSHTGMVLHWRWRIQHTDTDRGVFDEERISHSQADRVLSTLSQLQQDTKDQRIFRTFIVLFNILFTLPLFEEWCSWKPLNSCDYCRIMHISGVLLDIPRSIKHPAFCFIAPCFCKLSHFPTFH